jgi:hypothetical protein
MAGFALLQVPPTVVSLSVEGIPPHTVVIPVIAPIVGNGFTVTGFVATDEPHALVTLYEINAVPPDTPVTMPSLLPTLAIATALLLHVPPGTVEKTAIAPVWHTVGAPLIVPADGNTLIVITCVAVVVPQLVVIV